MPKLIVVKLLWTYGTIMAIALAVFLIAWVLTKIPRNSPWHPASWPSRIAALLTPTAPHESDAAKLMADSGTATAESDADAPDPTGGSEHCPKANYISRCPDCATRIHTPECPFEKMKIIQKLDEERRKNDWRIDR